MLRFFTIVFNKHKKSIIQVSWFLMVVVLLFSIFKDIGYALPMPWDLRNRIVGARMLEDGLSPYFYICKTGGSVRYQNLINYSSTLSLATASPFYHLAIRPMADLPQFQINIVWMFMEYMSLASCFLLSFFSIDKTDRNQKAWLIFTVITLFTFTIGWRLHVFTGQNYILTPLLAMASIYCINRGDKMLDIVMFAVFSSALILIRPVAILFFIPFVFFPKVYFKWTLATLLLISIYVMFVLYSPVQKTNWVNYFTAIQMHIDVHQAIATKDFKIGPSFFRVDQFEGVDLQWKSNNLLDNFSNLFEYSNLYGFYNKYANNKLSIKAMTTIGLSAVIILLMPLFWSIRNNLYYSPIKLMSLGFIIYDVFTFCSPALRPNYCWVEFLFPLLIMAIAMKKIYVLPILLTSLGLYLNIVAPIWIPARQNVGEILILTALLGYVYRPIIVYYFNESRWKINNGLFWL